MAVAGAGALGVVVLHVCGVGASTLTFFAALRPRWPTRINCLGDSHTRGVMGAPWLPSLQKRLCIPCGNHGCDGETAGAMVQRARGLSPSKYAVVLAGTNDALLELASRADNSAMVNIYSRQNGLPHDYRPNIESFSANFRELLQAVTAQVVVVASLPPVGESVEGEAADLISSYNAEIQDAVDEVPNAVYAPFGEALKERLPSGEHGQPFDASPSGFSSALRDLSAHRALRQLPFAPSFGAMARLRGREVLHDQIHLTESSSAALVDTVASAFKSVGVSGRCSGES